MADNPFDRLIINNLEKALSKDWNQGLSQLDRAIRYFAKYLTADNETGDIRSGFLTGSFKVVENNPVALSVIVKAGLGFLNDPTDVPSDINGILELDDLESFKPLPLISDHTFVVPTAPVAPNTRKDIIEVRADRLITNNQARRIFNPSTEAFDPVGVDKTLEFIIDGKTGTVAAPSNSTAALSYKVGVAANPGVAPATSTGYIKLAEVNVGSGVLVINNADILDTRPTFGRIVKWRIPASKFVTPFPTNLQLSTVSGTNWSPIAAFAGSRFILAPLEQFREGDQVQRVRFRGTESGVGGETLTGRLRYLDAAFAVQDVLTPKSSGTGGGPFSVQWTTADAGLPHTVDAENNDYYLEITFDAVSGAGTPVSRGALVEVLRPFGN